MYLEEDQENDLYLQQETVQNQKNDLYLEKEQDSGSDWDLEIILGIGIGIAVVVAGYYIYKKATATKTKKERGIDEGTKHAINSFIDDIILDYYNEYRINYLAVRYNIKELETKTSYVFTTNRIGSLSSIVDFSEISSGEKYLEDLLYERYNVVVPADDQLSFITEISRIEGKIKALESVKAQIPKEDYNKLICELEEDVMFYKKKYTIPELRVE